MSETIRIQLMEELFLNDYHDMGVFKRHLIDNGFFTAPASTKYHGNYEGGLFDHSVNVANKLQDMTKQMNLQWERSESPIVVGLFHDLCKMDEYKKIIDEEGTVMFGLDDNQGEEVHFEHNNNLLIKGHGDKSVMLLSQFMQLTEEELLCIRYHMGAYKTEDWKEYGKAVTKHPNVLWTHAADMYASKVMEEVK